MSSICQIQTPFIQIQIFFIGDVKGLILTAIGRANQMQLSNNCLDDT